MTVETANTFAELNPSSPLGTDFVAEGDDHLRLLKMLLKRTFADLPSIWRKSSTTEAEEGVDDVFYMTSAKVKAAFTKQLEGLFNDCGCVPTDDCGEPIIPCIPLTVQLADETLIVTKVTKIVLGAGLLLQDNHDGSVSLSTSSGGGSGRIWQQV